MKIFDLHCDIGSDCEYQLMKGELEPFKTRHLQKLIDGEVSYVCCACFFYGKETWDEMAKMIVDMNSELMKNDVVFVKDNLDYFKEHRVHGIISVEGMCGVQENPREKVQFMKEHNVKVASLAWNDENYLATGVKGNVCRGLTSAGLEAIDEMAKCGIALDVSHLNEASFWDVIKNHSGKVCATHSNARTLCSHDRNLTDMQIKALAAKGGIIGMNACRFFVSDNEEEQNVETLAKHAKYIADLVGVEHVACGFDFMDFFGEGGLGEMAKDIESDDKAQNFVEALRKVGFNEEEVEKICYKNALDFFTK